MGNLAVHLINHTSGREVSTLNPATLVVMPSAAVVRMPAARMPAPLAVSVALVGGIGLAAQGRINSELATRLDDGVGAALVSFVTGLIVMTVFTVVLPAGREGLRRIPRIRRERPYPWWFLLTGVVGAYFVFTQAVTIGPIGIALFTISVVAGQMLSGLAVDRIGMGPAGRRALTPARITGSVLTLAAAAIAVMPHFRASAQAGILLLLVLLPLIAGISQSFQQAVLGRVAAAHGTPVTSTFFNFAGGAVLLFVVWSVRAAATGTTMILPGEWWLYLGGPLGCLLLASTTLSVASVGVLLTGLAMIGGQLLGSLGIDILFPAPGSIVEVATVLGTVLTLAAIVIATLPWRGQALAAGRGL